jgi:hypothetical protein
MSKNNNPVAVLETQELLQKLIDAGHGELVDCLLEEASYTKKGRLNKSSTCRTMNWKGKQLEDALKEMRDILKSEMSLENA